jgi:phage portal protein BeeE
MGFLANFKDAFRRKKARDFAQELSYNFMQSPICSDYENLFAQLRPLIDEMKLVMPYGVGRNGARLPYKQTPELDLLHDPNDEMSWSDFADTMFSTWLSEEELDLHCHFSGKKLVAYTILPPQSRIYLGYGRWEWQVMTTDGMKTLTEEEVMRIRFSRSPRDIQKGVSPASAVRVWAQIDDLISQYQKAYFENGAIPATITFITASTEEKYRRTRDELENKLRGAKNRNKTVYAWRQFNNDTGESADQIEVKTIQGNNSTLAIREIVDIINDRLNKSVGVSNFILGDDSSAKYDNAELSDHQFTKRRVYPALMSFWNQFQHELERVLNSGLGYGISFDLAIPELTERKKAIAEINRITSETVVNLISAGASSASVVKALNLSDDWFNVANGIYENKLSGDLMSPVSIDYEKPKAIEATVDAKEKEAVEKKDFLEHKCSCHHTLDELPPMTKEEKNLYNLLVAMANDIKDSKTIEVDKIITEMQAILEYDAKMGAEDGAKALELLADQDVAGEIAKMLSNGEIYTSKALNERLLARADQLVRGYQEYTKNIVAEVLNSSENMTANEIKKKLAEVLPESRAEMIARNETVYAIKSGRLEQDEELAKKYDLQVELVWRTSGDAKVCDLCREMDGQVVKLGDAFTSVETQDGQTWDATSWNDYGRIPDAHVNCRCYFDERLVK